MTTVTDTPLRDTPGAVTPDGVTRSWGMGDTDTDLARFVRWMRDLRGLRPETIRVRVVVLNRFAAVVDRPLREVETGHVMAWEQLVVLGKAPQTRRAYIGAVTALYKWMVDSGIRDTDPTELLTRPKVPKPLPRPIGEEDLQLALDSASVKLAAMMTLMAYAGLRCIEVSQISWADIDTSGDQAWLTVRDGKGAKDRSVPIGMAVLTRLRRYGQRNRGVMFLGHDGKAINKTSVSQIVNAHLARLNIPHTAHNLRARYATRAAEHAPITLVAELCGWSSINTARHYVRPDRSQSAALVAAMDELANPA